MPDKKSEASNEYLQADEFFCFEHPQVRDFIAQHAAGGNPLEKLLSFYLEVRDLIRYNPYKFSPNPHTMTAAYAVIHRQTYCIPKAVLFAAGARFLDFPARLGLVDVRNHLASPQLLEWLKTDYFAMHGYAEIFIDGKWVKATPAFNKELCEKFDVLPLEFDGKSDSVFQEFTNEGKKHMEYIKERGSFATVPVSYLLAELAKIYPHFKDMNAVSLEDQSLENDLKR